VLYVAQRCRPGFQSELAHWIENSPRFRAFLTTNQDKVRKKLSTDDEEHRLDVRAELLVAYLIAADRRFELAFEAYGARRLGPDLTLTFRANERLNLEVTRVRTTGDADRGLHPRSLPEGEGVSESASREPDSSVARLANVVTGKLRQLPGDTPNAVVIVARGLPLNADSLIETVRLLKLHTDRKDDAFFVRRGLKDARDFYARYLQLGGICVLDEASTPARAIFYANREARHPLSATAVHALTHCLTSASGTPRA